jgi:hypothetical protein
MLIASKYEEIYPPMIRDFVYITDKSCSKQDIIKFELEVLETLEFDILYVSSYTFLERFSFISRKIMTNNNVFFWALFILELSLLEVKMNQYKPSIKAAAALKCARKLYKLDWNDNLISYTGYEEKDLESCYNDYKILMKMVPRTNLNSSINKFSNPKYGEITKKLKIIKKE